MYRFYIAEQIGDGSKFNPWRSAVRDIIGPDDSTKSLIGMDDQARGIWLGVVWASQDLHDQIEASPLCYIISPIVDDSQWPQCLNVEFNQWPVAVRQEAAANMEAFNISTSWITASNTFRDVLRWLMRRFIIANLMALAGDVSKDIFLQSLDKTVSQIPPDIRQPIRDWMQARGLAIGWITNQTTVREILHFIVMNLGFGQLTLIGENI